MCIRKLFIFKVGDVLFFIAAMLKMFMFVKTNMLLYSLISQLVILVGMYQGGAVCLSVFVYGRRGICGRGPVPQ